MNTASDEARSERSCAECRFAYVGECGYYCVSFGEFIDDEVRAASDCPIFETTGALPVDPCDLPGAGLPGWWQR